MKLPPKKRTPMVTCPTCDGLGYVDDPDSLYKDPKTCPDCFGGGRTRQ